MLFDYKLLTDKASYPGHLRNSICLAACFVLSHSFTILADSDLTLFHHRLCSAARQSSNLPSIGVHGFAIAFWRT